MSMIDCKVNIEKKPDPKGDRVVLTFEYVLMFRLPSYDPLLTTTFPL